MLKRLTRSKLFQINQKEVVVAISVASQNYNNGFLLKTNKNVLFSSIIEEGLDRAKTKFQMPSDLKLEFVTFEDGSRKSTFGLEERIGNKHVIIFYKSEELMEDRMNRLEERLQNLETDHKDLENAHKDLENAHKTVKNRLDESDQHLLCGCRDQSLISSISSFGKKRPLLSGQPEQKRDLYLSHIFCRLGVT